jgi:hypothetical protein
MAWRILRGNGTRHGASDGRSAAGVAAGGGEQPENEPKPRLPIGPIVAAAARAGWRHRWRVLGVAVAVSTLTSLVEIVGTNLTDHASVALAAFTALFASGVSVLGTVFLSGFLCRLVGEAEHGSKHATVRQVARALPWRRLVLADLLVVLIVVIGLVALVIPGLAAMTLLAVVGPLIELEHRRVIASLRRSAQLVRQHFWTVALLATVPVLAASSIESVIPDPDTAGQIVAALAVRGVAGGLVEAAIGLTLVELCYRLIAAHRRLPGAGRGAQRVRRADARRWGPSSSQHES